MAIATTGFFDGVHKGHRLILDEVVKLARKDNTSGIAISFWPHPRNVLQQDAYALRLLTTLEEKKKLILEAGIDEFVPLPFTREFSMMSTHDFLKDYIKGKFSVTTLVIGYDHKLGHDINMPQSEMISIAESMGINIVRIGEFIEDGLTVSSTKIRRLLRAGNVVTARNFLGYPYCLCGIVVKGNGIGRTMGFPTANMQLSYPLKLVPGDGVYAVRVYVNNLDVPYRGICNIGKRPTISNNSAVTIETNILDYDEDIYGLDLKIEFISRMRNEIKFPSLNELTLQLQRDRKCARNIIEL